MVFGFSLAHSLQRNFLSERICACLGKRRLQSPKKTWSGKVTRLSYNQLLPHSQHLPESNGNFSALSEALNNDYCYFLSGVWIIKTDDLKCMLVCVVEQRKWGARRLHILCSELFSRETLHLLGNWHMVEVWSVSRAGNRWALFYSIIFKPPQSLMLHQHLERARGNKKYSGSFTRKINSLSRIFSKGCLKILKIR